MDKNVENNILKAENNGVLVYSKEYSEGDFISTGSVIGTILPDTGEVKAVLYVPEKDITDITKGMSIEFILSSISISEYGKATGTITSISADSFANSSENGKYFRMEAEIDDQILRGKEGSIKEIQPGMNIEANIITGTKRIIYWLLDKLNFM